MGDVLAGIHATWEFESDALVIRFERGNRNTPKLFSALRERRVPHEALASVTLTPGKRGTVVLHAVPRPGADPLMEAAAGQLKEACDPYRLVLPADRETLAEYYRDELRALLPADAGMAEGAEGADAGGTGEAGEAGEAVAVRPADGFLVAAPAGPLSFKTYDGRASFDGMSEVAFRWSWTGASSEKWKAGDQTFSVRELSGVEWRSPEILDGYLRLVPRDGGARPAQPDRDPASVVFGLGYGPVHESLPFAAAVLAAIRGKDRVPVAVTAGVPDAARRDPGAVAERIRHLGDLHRAGLVTDEEFSAKKAELLAEL
ncbi:hypothetical protein AQF52_2477 [Streptomyces venezuelae]|uniref:DUF4429 domain-containing protein n=1 Tax=Streptomyces gardneri TaxID=66892 RepID=UPI0006BC7951|nr:DUF4429 domain-containing protein [Streptomyces gardneri]ALO08072.1 hypothetical protein AQF52_2477 [Streptomyces venezuelae]QPK45343.1 DUF4429 domain-containing protein [Streptomyces gardneri]WRK36666.1 DUF4429 domain-containing protein [Streptomyces venezuelae]CUM41581.1 FIG01121141: hypothetical protein [Streptomyces venezuelae]